MTKEGSDPKADAQYVSYCALSQAEMQQLAAGPEAKRVELAKPLGNLKSEDVLKVAPMGFFAEMLCMIFLGLGVPNGIFTIPPLLFLVGRFLVGNVRNTFLVFSALMVPLVLLPAPFKPASLQGWLATQMVKYFSFRVIAEHRPEKGKPHILVAPPHGVFPYGNLLTMISFPSTMGYAMHGLAASSALSVPIFKQILRTIGVIDASRASALKALQQSQTIGISTGGVAEVFETNSADECIVLHERKGMVKLAIRTGADLIPCYVFGNTKLLSCWSGEGIPGAHSFLKSLSRKVGFACILIFGRLGLPIPYRVPVFGVLGKAIPVQQCEEPSQEEIDRLHGQLCKDMQSLFDRYKGLYGWQDKQLVIK